MAKDGKGRLWIVIASWAAVLAWMGFIFYLSSQVAEASSKLSAGVTEVFIRMIRVIAPRVDFDIDMFNYVIRKSAHFFSYFILGLLTMNALRRSGMAVKRCIAAALLICVLYAVSDEFHQLFVPGRAGQVQDVLIDAGGSALGIISYSLFIQKKICD